MKSAPADSQPQQWRSGSAQNWKTGGARFKPRSRLSTQPFGVSRGFLRNSHKYGLGSLRKTPTEGNPPIVPGPTSGQLDLYLHPSIHPKVVKPCSERLQMCKPVINRNSEIFTSLELSKKKKQKNLKKMILFNYSLLKQNKKFCQNAH